MEEDGGNQRQTPVRLGRRRLAHFELDVTLAISLRVRPCEVGEADGGSGRGWEQRRRRLTTINWTKMPLFFDLVITTRTSTIAHSVRNHPYSCAP
jgi:hypothetical protein